MEFNINILDSFPSLNKIPQKNNLFLEFNNKEYSLNKLISQQEIITLKKSISKLNFKIYFITNSKKLLIGANNINQESIKFDINNKNYTTWIEFRKRIPDNISKDINDINFLFFDCIRLKIKISLIKIIPKTDKRIKNNRSKIKLGAKTPKIPKKEDAKFKFKDDNIDINFENDDNNNLNSYRNFDTNYLLKSKSQEENVKLNSDELDNIKVNTNYIIEKYNNLRLKSEESISHEMKNLLQIENDCLLTDNNLLENYSYSTSLGDNNNKNLIKSRIENENKIISDIIKNDNINYEFIPKNNLLSFNNYKSLNKQEQNLNLMNESLNDENDTNKKISSTKQKFKGISKLIKINNKKNDKKIKQIKNNNINKSNSNNVHSLIKEKIYFNSNTYNNFYKKNIINDENNQLSHLETNINDINNNKNVYMNNLLISHKTELRDNKINKDEKTIISDEYEEFISMKKDYELLYTPAFIKEIKKDLLDLEFNIALEKSISLFLYYNNQISSFFKQKNELLTIIKNYMNKIEILNKKSNLLKTIKGKDEIKASNKLLFDELDNNLKRNYLAQKNIFENLINDKINKKQALKSIIGILLKKNNTILDNIKQNKKKENENLKTNMKSNNNNKYIIKSPSRSTNKLKIKSPQVVKQKQKFEFMSEIKNKNSIFANKLINKKKSSNHNLKKNKSINYLVSLENIHEKNSEKNTIKESKANIPKNNLFYFSTAKNKFYISKCEKGNK